MKSDCDPSLAHRTPQIGHLFEVKVNADLFKDILRSLSKVLVPADYEGQSLFIAERQRSHSAVLIGRIRPIDASFEKLGNKVIKVPSVGIKVKNCLQFLTMCEISGFSISHSENNASLLMSALSPHHTVDRCSS